MDKKRPLICARPGCGLIMFWAETIPRQPCRCERCGRLTAFTPARGKLRGELVPYEPRPQQDELSEFDRHDRMMRRNPGVDPKKC